MKRTVSVIVIFLILTTTLRARTQYYNTSSDFAIGPYFSLKGSGVAITTKRADIRVFAVFDGILLGERITPGIRGDLFYKFNVMDKPLEGKPNLLLDLGPGLSLGYLRDRGKEWGIMTGICSYTAATLQYPYLDISLGFSATLGSFVTLRDVFHSKMTPYKNGFKNILAPELMIKYRF